MTELDREYQDQGEKDIAEELIIIMQEEMRERGVPIRRGQHAKSTGCVRAEFIVDSAPKEYSFGIFKQKNTFEAIIRFSNSQGTIEKDKETAGRGVAIKLFGIDEGVYGGWAMPETPSRSQDFLMVNHPVFPFSNPADYRDFLKRRRVPIGGKIFAVLGEAADALISGDRTLSILRDIKDEDEKVASPLEERYWSGSPYWLGEPDGSAGCTVKYSLIPKDISASTKRPEDDFLRQALINHLAERDAEFYFAAQKQIDADRMPIENTSINWDETVPVPQRVAILRIPRQTEAAIAALEKECEHLSFHPWHALAAHRPMGGINRLRKAVYNAGFKERSPAK